MAALPPAARRDNHNETNEEMSNGPTTTLDPQVGQQRRVMWRGDFQRGRPARVTVPAGPTSLPNRLVYDSEGEEVWSNTHFKTEREAWDFIEREAEASLSMIERAQKRNDEEEHALYIEHRDMTERLAEIQEARSQSAT